MSASAQAWVACELARLSWYDVEQYLEHDDRLVFTIGATEEHAHLSLATDTLLGSEVARGAAATERVLLAPPFPFGNSGWAAAYPGTLSLRPRTLATALSDLIRSAYATGFRGIFVVSGHSGNDAVAADLQLLTTSLPGLRCDYFAWYRETEILELARSIRPDGLDHANWGENTRFTRLGHHPASTEPQEPPQFRRDYVLLHPLEVRAASPALGMHGSLPEIADEESEPLLDLAVEIACARLQRLAG